MRKRLIHYGLDGNLISEQKLSINSIIAEPIGKYVAMHTEYHKNEELEDDGKYPNLILIDPISQEICSTQNFFSTPIKQTIVWSTGCWFSSWDDTLSIKPDHSNIVYHIANDSIYPAYLLDFGLYNIDNRYWDKALETNISLQQVDDYCNNLGLCEIFKFLESKDYIYFVFKQKQKMRHVLISKKTKKKYIIESLKNDIDDITIFFPKAINGNKLYCLIDANNIMLLKKSLKGKLPQTLLDSVQESDNPIIAELTLKEF